MGSSIIVASAKGGVGKTNTIVNLGVALAEAGKKVAVIDGSLTTPDLSLHLGIPFNISGLSNLLKKKATLKSSIFEHKSGMKVIPGNVHINVLKEFEGKQFANLLKQLKKNHDFVLVDCSAGLGREALSAMKHCDKMLVITNPELASVVNASKAIQLAKGMKVKPIGVVINRSGRFKQELKRDEIEPLMHKVKILGHIREDKRVPASIRAAEAVLHTHPKSAVSREFRNIANTFLPKSKQSDKGLFSRIYDAIRNRY